MGCFVCMSFGRFSQILMELKMKLKTIIPAPEAVLREGVIVLGGLLIAAFVISRFPKLQQFVTGNSITIKNQSGEVLY